MRKTTNFQLTVEKCRFNWVWVHQLFSKGRKNLETTVLINSKF